MTEFHAEHRVRSWKDVLKTAVAASVSLYAVVALLAEPMRALGATTDSETAVVEVTIGAGLGMACDANNDNTYGSGETLSLPTITFTGDTGTYATTRQVTCKIVTSSTTGWALSWQILAGSGGFGTGHLISQYENIIPAFGTGSFNNTSTWSVSAADSRWGGRVSSTSSGAQAGAMNFGTDVSAERYARVATGSTQTIRQKVGASQQGGDKVRVHFRAEVGSSKVQPTGTYRATVTFTATVQ